MIKTFEESQIEYERLRKFVKEKNYDEAIAIGLRIVKFEEASSAMNNWGVAPAIYLDLAKTYRKTKALKAELEILERYFLQRLARGRLKFQMADRYNDLCQKYQHEVPEKIKPILQSIADDTIEDKIFMESLL